MDSSTGEIYSFETKEALTVAQQKREQENQQKLVELSREQAEFLEHFPAHERNELHKNLLSKNHSAKRRARNKIAKASRQRNRK